MSATYGPYSPIRQAGNYYFISGQVGTETNKTVSQHVEKQCRQAFENLQNILESAALTMKDVVKTTVFVTNMADFTTINDVYMEYFSEPRPARSCVAVAELPRLANNPVLVEIEAIAYKEAA